MAAAAARDNDDYDDNEDNVAADAAALLAVRRDQRPAMSHPSAAADNPAAHAQRLGASHLSAFAQYSSELATAPLRGVSQQRGNDRQAAHGAADGGYSDAEQHSQRFSRHQHTSEESRQQQITSSSESAALEGLPALQTLQQAVEGSRDWLPGGEATSSRRAGGPASAVCRAQSAPAEEGQHYVSSLYLGLFCHFLMKSTMCSDNLRPQVLFLLYRCSRWGKKRERIGSR